jgi:membrane-bound metal-dependent hydrolase YbcI (DUF457 family)
LALLLFGFKHKSYIEQGKASNTRSTEWRNWVLGTQKENRVMNAINHAATALVIKKYYPSTPIIPILVSVQLIEILWVVLNIAGIERTSFSSEVSSLADVHLVHMPYSHSLLFTFFWALSAWFIVSKILNKPNWGLAVFIGVCSHIILDLATHTRDIEIIPFLN